MKVNCNFLLDDSNGAGRAVFVHYKIRNERIVRVRFAYWKSVTRKRGPRNRLPHDNFVTRRLIREWQAHKRIGVFRICCA